MKKRILALVAVLTLVALVVPAAVFSAEDTVSCTVATYFISVSVDDGSVNYGLMSLDETLNTAIQDMGYNPHGMPEPQTQTITNTGTVDEKFKIKTSNADGTTDWMLGLTAGSDIFTHAYNVTNTAYTGAGTIIFTKWTAADTYVSAGTTTAPAGHNYLELEIGMPTSATDPGTHTITVTVMAEAA